MLKLIIPSSLLKFIDSHRLHMSRPTYILKCVNYIMINNINLNNDGDNINEGTQRSDSRGKNTDNNRL